MPHPPRVLIVEDDHATRHSLALVFSRKGYAVEAVGGGRPAIDRLAGPVDQAPVDVVLSDISLGDTDGIAVLKAARAGASRPEVILMTGYSTVQTAVEALRAGAFDYLFKPCDLQQLLETVQRALVARDAERERARAWQAISVSLKTLQSLDGPPEPRAAPPPLSEVRPARDERFLQLGRLQLDPFTRTATFAGRPLHLTPTEFSLLLCLGEMPGKVHGYQELVLRVYGHDVDERQARVLLKGHVHNLRAKLDPQLIQAARGVGYLLNPALE